MLRQPEYEQKCPNLQDNEIRQESARSDFVFIVVDQAMQTAGDGDEQDITQ